MAESTVSRIRLGDIYIDRRYTGRQQPSGRAYVCDLVPFEDGPVTRVCLELEGGAREWLEMGELDRRFHRR